MSVSRRSFLQSAAALPAVAAGSSAAPPASDRITIGVIGCGARAQQLIDAIQANPGTEITAVVDAYKGRVERAIDRTQGRAKVRKDYREVLADKTVDAVVIATPDHWHQRMILDAIAAGKDVYAEKPLTYRASEGRAIVDAAAKAGRMVQVGSQVMSSPAAAKAKEWIDSGRLGKVTLIRTAYNRNTASGAWIYPIPPDASPETVDWQMFLGNAPKRPFSAERFFRWRCYQDYSGGIATDLFVHLATTIHYVMNAKSPGRVAAMGQLYRWKESREVPDTLNALLEYPEGFAVNLSSSFNNQAGAEGSFQFHGTEGTLTLGFTDVQYLPETATEDNKWIVDSWTKPMEEAYFRDPKVIATEVNPPKRGGKPEVFKDEGPESTVAHFARFFESMRTRKPYWEDALAGHRAAAVAHMVNLSVRQARMVSWDAAKDDIRA